MDVAKETLSTYCNSLCESSICELPIVDREIINHFNSLPLDYWDFVSYSKEYTHGIHTYPAMMIPPIPKNLINIVKSYQPQVKNLVDPFLGSGTVLLEGLLAGMNAWGLDLNPLACLISKAKCTLIDPAVLKRANENILRNIGSCIGNNKLKVEKPNFYNINYWFKEYVIRHLQIVKNQIKEVDDPDIRTLYWVAFSETVRDCSNTRNGEFKLYRISEDRLFSHNPSVLDIFKVNLDRCERGMAEFYDHYRGGGYKEILAQDTRDFDLGEKMDLMITSPPYGDSRTTVAYGQFSRLSLQWLDLEEHDFVSSEIEKERLDKYLLGGVNEQTENNLPSESLRKALGKISKKDQKRALDVLSFYIDLDKCMSSITKHMKINSYQFWVVGNRTVRKTTIPTDKIISELGAQYNLKTIITVPRNISSKRMPKKNSPSNEKGKKSPTMSKENIVVLRKVK